MRLFSFVMAMCLLFVFNFIGFAQNKTPNKYEVEILSNPTAGKKDTREVNSVIIFEADKLIIKSRRKDEVFKEFKYSDLKSAEHSYSKRPWVSQAAVSAIATAVSGFPLWIGNDEKHWLTVIADGDFFVLKLENDNYRQIRAEFEIRKITVENIKEGADNNKPAKSKDADKPKDADKSKETSTETKSN